MQSTKNTLLSITKQSYSGISIYTWMHVWNHSDGHNSSVHCEVSAEVIGEWVTEVCAGFVIIDVFVVSDNDAYMIINVILIVRNWEGKTGRAPIDLSNGCDRGKIQQQQNYMNHYKFLRFLILNHLYFLYFIYDVYKS